MERKIEIKNTEHKKVFVKSYDVSRDIAWRHGQCYIYRCNVTLKAHLVATSDRENYDRRLHPRSNHLSRYCRILIFICLKIYKTEKIES